MRNPVVLSSSLHVVHDGIASQTASPALSPPTNPMFLFPAVPIADGLWDLATISLIAGILILSVLSLTFIFHLHLRSRLQPHLGHFNSLWKVRLVLVLFVAFWALNELLRLPFFRQSYLYPNFPSLTVAAQTNVCKLHVVLSLGFYEPGFLVTLLFLVNVSIKKTERSRMWAIPSVCAVCFPMLLLQAFVVFFSPLQAMLPGFMHGSSVLSSDLLGRSAVLCTYPALSCIIFTVFAVAYTLAFLMSCWQVVLFVINKTIGGRVYFLAVSVIVTLPIQIFCLGLTSIWLPVDPVYNCAVSTMFLSVLWCMTVSELILVIKPIADALDAGGALWISTTQLLGEMKFFITGQSFTSNHVRAISQNEEVSLCPMNKSITSADQLSHHDTFYNNNKNDNDNEHLTPLSHRHGSEDR